VQDTTGALSHLGDQGDHFYLAGAFTSDPIVREVTVYDTQTLFFPLINVISPAPFFGNTEAELRQDAYDNMANIHDTYVSLNGNTQAPAPGFGWGDYNQFSPLFDMVFPDGNLFGLPADTYKTVSYGAWVAMKPLTVGDHELKFGANVTGINAYKDFSYSQDITYKVKVKANIPEPGTFAFAATGLLPLFGLIRRRYVNETK
jgi:hypothetical protein